MHDHIVYVKEGLREWHIKIKHWGLRSSRPEVFCKKVVLRNFTKWKGKHVCQSLFFNKVAGLRPANLLKKRLWHRCFPVKFCEIFKNTFFYRTALVAASENSNLCVFSTDFTSFSVSFFLSLLITIFFFARCSRCYFINPRWSSLNHPSAKVLFVFENFNVHHKDWLTYSGGTDDLVN